MSQDDKNHCSCENHAQDSLSSQNSSSESCSCKESGEELQVNFFNYVMSMAYQAMIFLGEVPNPMTNQQEVNLRQAKFLIDTLQMIKDKTKGNVSAEEENMLASSLSELQMKYVAAVKK